MRNLLSAVGYVDSLSEVACIMKVTVEKSRARSAGCNNCPDFARAFRSAARYRPRRTERELLLVFSRKAASPKAESPLPAHALLRADLTPIRDNSKIT